MQRIQGALAPDPPFIGHIMQIFRSFFIRAVYLAHNEALAARVCFSGQPKHQFAKDGAKPKGRSD